MEHGYPEPAYEPDLGVRTRPDYVVVRGEAEAVCEVEEFDPDSGWSPGNAGPSGRRSMEDVLRPVRYKIRAAARQLKTLAGSGRPLVIVLANPGGAWVGLSPQEIVWAMYGDPAFVFSVAARTGEAVDEGGFITTANGKLRNDHPYISAVAVVSQRDRAIDYYDELVAGVGVVGRRRRRVIALPRLPSSARRPLIRGDADVGPSLASGLRVASAAEQGAPRASSRLLPRGLRSGRRSQRRRARGPSRRSGFRALARRPGTARRLPVRGRGTGARPSACARA